MDKKFLGRAGAASVDFFHHDQSSDETFIETVQDIEPIIEQNKRDYNDAPLTFTDQNGVTFRHVGRIPDVIVADLMKRGIWQDPEALKRFLNDPDNRFFPHQARAPVMADLDTYAGLQAFIARTLQRTDLAADIPLFIQLAEAQMQRRLRTSDMIARTTFTVSNGYGDVPDDFAGVRTLDLDTDPPTGLDFTGSSEMIRRGTVYFTAGKPTAFSIVGSEFQFSPAPDASYTARMSYWQRIPALSDTNPANWLLEKHPDAYLYGACVQSAPFLRADDRLATWGTLFSTALADIEADDSLRSYGATPRMRARSLG